MGVMVVPAVVNQGNNFHPCYFMRHKVSLNDTYQPT